MDDRLKVVTGVALEHVHRWSTKYWPWVLAFALILLGVLYAFDYDASIYRPRIGARYPLGWWGWADQGEYIKSVQAFAHGRFQSENFHYPPLYALTAAPFWPFMPSHPFYIPDLIALLVSYGVVLAVARRFYGLGVPLIACGCLLIYAPIISIQQWVIPWTSSLMSALGAILILIASLGESRPAPFALKTRRDWLMFCAFFITYGAIAPTRPLDIVVWLPFALAFFAQTVLATIRTAESRNRGPIALICITAAAACALVFVLFYLGFNLAVQGSLLGTYARVLNSGYIPSEIVEKIFSIFWESQTVFVVRGDALFQKFPIFAPIFAVCLVTLFAVRDIRFWVLLTVFLQFLLYLPFGDLLPTGIFTYFNIHYFKWGFPWLAVIALGQSASWLRGLLGRDRRRNVGFIIAALVVLLVCCNLSLEPVGAVRVEDRRSSTNHTISITAPHPRRVEFVDIKGLRGGLLDFYFGQHRMVVDGEPAPDLSFRILQENGGGRLIFLKPRRLSQIVLTPDPNVTFDDGAGQSVIQSSAVEFGCRFRNCVEPLRNPLPHVGWTQRAITFAFRDGGDLHGAATDDWWPAELWGRWSRTNTPELAVIVTPPGSRRLRLTTIASPLIAPGILHQHVALWVNRCKVAERAFKTGDRQVLDGQIDTACLGPNGEMRVQWRTDGTHRPVDLGLGPDYRALGVGVQSLTVQVAP
jgi:hypothetical protein